jgi:hypothetical protein
MPINESVLKEFGRFVNAINERELLKQQGKGYSYVPADHFNEDEKRALDIEVMYWHPNRSHHDEVMWLNRVVFNDRVEFRDKVLNSAVVKFYGPSEAVEVAAGQKDSYVDFMKFRVDSDYRERCLHNLNTTKKSIWGKTELRTSLQTAARNYMRYQTGDMNRKMHASDILSWVSSFEDKGLIEFFQNQPTIEESYRELTKRPGIGAYYGYHFTCNLSRCEDLQMDENEDFCVPGPGACQTLGQLYPGLSPKKYMDAILEIKKDQESLLEYDVKWIPAFEKNKLNPDPDAYRLTTFGVEIACCQFSVFQRFVSNPGLISKRKILDPRLIKEKESDKSGLAQFFS